MYTVKDLSKTINWYFIRYICIPLKKETKRFLLFFESSKSDDKERIVLLFQSINKNYHESNIYYGEVKGCNTIKNSKNSKIIPSKENSELKKNNIFCYEMSEAVFDNISNLAVKIVEKSPEMLNFLEEQKETQRLISQFYTLAELSGKKAVHNNRYLEFFNSPN